MADLPPLLAEVIRRHRAVERAQERLDAAEAARGRAIRAAKRMAGPHTTDEVLAALADHGAPIARATLFKWIDAGAPPTEIGTAGAGECTCLYSCADDPATACSLSGTWHVHPQDRRGVTGPCPEHPDAPGDH